MIVVGTLYFLFVLLHEFISVFQDVLLPLAIAAIFATLLRPIITYFEVHTRLNRTGGILLLLGIVLLAQLAIAVYAIPPALSQALGLIETLPAILARFLERIEQWAPAIWHWLTVQIGGPPKNICKIYSPRIPASSKKHWQKSRSLQAPFLQSFGNLFAKIAAYSIIPVYLFFLLNGDRNIWKDMNRQLSFLPDGKREDLIFLIRQFSEILVSFFRGQIIIGLLLGLVLAIGFGLVGLKFGILLGFFLGLLNIIPYLGTMIGILTVLPLAYFQEGGGGTLIGLCAIVFIIGQVLTDYVFTPRIMGEKTGMSPMLIIFSVFFWGVALGGLLGMILAIPLTAFFLVFWRLAREKYLPALTSENSSSPQLTLLTLISSFPLSLLFLS